MKKNKWLKWKIGAAVSLGLGFLFNEVKSSAAFAEKVQAAGSDGGGTKPNAAADMGQSDLFAYHGGDGPSSGQVSGGSRRGPRHRSGSFSDLGGGDGSGPSSGSGGSGSGSGSYTTPTVPSAPAVPGTRTHTRTGRS